MANTFNGPKDGAASHKMRQQLYSHKPTYHEIETNPHLFASGNRCHQVTGLESNQPLPKHI